MKRLLLLAFACVACTTTGQPTSAPSSTAPQVEETSSDGGGSAEGAVQESKTDEEGDAAPSSVDLVNVTVLRTNEGMIVSWTRASRDPVPEGAVFSATVRSVIYAAKFAGRPTAYAFDLSTNENRYGDPPNQIGTSLSIAIVGDAPTDLGDWVAAVEIDGRTVDEVA